MARLHALTLLGLVLGPYRTNKSKVIFKQTSGVAFAFPEARRKAC
jgi:hypothetical protein